MRRLIVLLAFVTTSLSAEQKNVKLLTGMTDLELQRTMNLMRASMGTHCDYCHVIKDQSSDWASDEKPTKIRAREMIRMVMDINRSTFGGRSEVSCFTCHRGSPRPVSLVSLPQAKPLFPTPLPDKPVLPDAKAVVAKYAAVLGDTRGYGSRILKGERTTAAGSIPFELEEKGAKAHFALLVPNKKQDQGHDGVKGWWRTTEGTEPMDARDEENFLALKAAYAPILPASIGDDARTVAKERIGESDVWEVERGLMRYYFDTQSGLLIRSVLLTPRPIGTIPQQTDYEDYRDVNGTKFPFRIRVSLVDPWTGATRQYTSVQLGATIDDAVFEKP